LVSGPCRRRPPLPSRCLPIGAPCGDLIVLPARTCDRRGPYPEPIRRQPAPIAKRVPRLPRTRCSQCSRRTRTDHDALGNAAAARRLSATPVRRTGGPGWRWKADAWSQPTSFAEYAPESNQRPAKGTLFGLRSMTTGRCSPSAGSGPSSGGDRGTKSKSIPGPHLVPDDCAECPR
jgi:hypothetical protein